MSEKHMTPIPQPYASRMKPDSDGELESDFELTDSEVQGKRARECIAEVDKLVGGGE